MTQPVAESLPTAIAYDPISGLVVGATYTLTAQVLVPANSPSVAPVVLDTGVTGAFVTARDTWTPVTFTFTAPTSGTVTLGWVTDGSVVDNTSRCYIDDVALRMVGPPAYFDGDTATQGGLDYRWTGTQGNSASAAYDATQALLAGPIFTPGGRFIADWTLQPTSGPVQVWVGAVSPDGGTILDQQGPIDVTGLQTLHYEPGQPPQVNFRPAIWVTGTGVDFSLVTYAQRALSDEECIAPYQRTYPQVTTVEGPLVTGQEVTDCGDRMLYVTWTWAAGSPFRYGVPTTLIAGLTSSSQETQQGPGVIGTPMGQISAAAYNCPIPTPPVSCASDPCYVGFTAPPTGPTIADPSRPNITTQQVRAASVYIPEYLTPEQQGVFTFILGNDANDKVGVRVRVYEDVPATGTPSDLCDFAYEYLIDYIAPGGIFTIDGITGTGQVLCQGDAYPVDASTVVRGNFGGPVQDPVAHCGHSYYVVVMWLAIYPWTCTNYYVSGQPQGELSVAVNVAPREG